MEIFHFPETVQVLSILTFSNQSSINLRQKRTKLRHLPCDKIEGKLLNPRDNIRKSWADLPLSFS